MRKKKHCKISPSDKAYDGFYLVNYCGSCSPDEAGIAGQGAGPPAGRTLTGTQNGKGSSGGVTRTAEQTKRCVAPYGWALLTHTAAG